MPNVGLNVSVRVPTARVVVVNGVGGVWMVNHSSGKLVCLLLLGLVFVLFPLFLSIFSCPLGQRTYLSGRARVKLLALAMTGLGPWRGNRRTQCPSLPGTGFKILAGDLKARLQAIGGDR